MVGGGRVDRGTGSSARKKQPSKKAKGGTKVSVEILDCWPGRNSTQGALLKSLVKSRNIVGMTPWQVYNKTNSFNAANFPSFV
jgi:hypothetical protein